MFDVYDREARRFWSTAPRDELAAVLGVSVAPCLYRGRVSMTQLQDWVFGSLSRFRQGDAEGVVVRKEDAMWRQARAKLVRPNFAQAITQPWRNRVPAWNHIDYKKAALIFPEVAETSGCVRPPHSDRKDFARVHDVLRVRRMFDAAHRPRAIMRKTCMSREDGVIIGRPRGGGIRRSDLQSSGRIPMAGSSSA